MQAGLDAVGVTTADPFPDVLSTLRNRKRDGSSADLTFTFNRPDRSTDIRSSIPWARALVVGARAYLPETVGHRTTAGKGRIARFMTGTGYDGLRAGLMAVAEELQAQGARTEIVCDDNRLVDRAAAVRAGIGWWGKNTMVLVPGSGPWTLLGSVVTDHTIEPSAPDRRDCGTCAACIPACPTAALTAPGVLDARRCLAAVLQLPGAIPEWMRPHVGDRIYGCDDCIEACPPGRRLLAISSTGPGVDLEWILTASDEELIEHVARLYLPRRRPDALRRNALVVLGNQRDPRSLPLIDRYLRHPDEVLSSHARWAHDRVLDGVVKEPAPQFEESGK